MKIEARCLRAREAWMSAVDEGRPFPEAFQRHLTDCPDCREFTSGVQRAGEEIRRLPLREPDPAADRLLLARLRERPQFSIFNFQLKIENRTLSLAGAGLASFAVTLLVAAVLSTGAGSAESGAPVGSTPAGGQYSTDLQAHLDDWLNSPTPSALPPRAPQVPPRREFLRRDPVLRSRRSGCGPIA